MNRMTAKLEDALTERVIGLAMRVHNRLGPGFLESVYRKALLVELHGAGLASVEEARVKVTYEGVSVGEFVADIIVEGRVVLELKAGEGLSRAHEMQTVNYLMATGLDIALLINFGGGRLQFKRKYRERRPVVGTAPLLRSDTRSHPVHPEHPAHPVESVERPLQEVEPYEAHSESERSPSD